MDPKRLATGTVVGGVLMFAIGYLFWTVLFAGFFEAHGGSATGMEREAPIWWAAVVGTFLLAALLTHALDWSGASSMRRGSRPERSSGCCSGVVSTSSSMATSTSPT